MKKYIQLLFFFSFAAFISCEQKPKENKKPEPVPEAKFQAGKIYAASCDDAQSNSYSVYLPSGYDTAKTFPVIYFFDPHGKGNLPVEKYKSLADEFGIILIGSNDTKNGIAWKNASEAAKQLFADTKQKFKINETKKFTCGFSGGARIAFNLALINKSVSGVISCSAGFPARAAQIRKDFIYVGIAGKEDMNLTEVYDAAENLKESELRHLITYFDGPHEWCPMETMSAAMKFCLTPAQSKSENTIDKKIIEREKQQKKIYGEAFVKKDLTWWKKEFQSLEQRIETTVADEKYMNIRLKNFLSLAAFSYSNSALSSGKLPEADKFLSIYKSVDPKNSEHAYLRAKYFMLINNSAEAEKALSEAAELGFDDVERLESEQLFITLHNSEGYKKITAK